MPTKGNLKDFKLEEVIQMITAGKKSGKLEINSKKRRYRIYFKNGEILHASAPFSNGEDAIKDVFLEEDGVFEFVQNIVLPPKTINKNTMEVIFNGMSVREECKEVKEVFTGDKKIQVSTNVGDNVSVSETEWKILKRLAEGKTLDQILEEEELSYYKACIILMKIIKKGLIKIT
jgi:DNA-binding CsgD family transcriptional regulator